MGFSLSFDFLEKDPSAQRDNNGYENGSEKLKFIVNGVAERDINLLRSSFF